MKKFLLFMLGVLIALPGIARNFSYPYEGTTLNYTVLDEEAKTCAVTETVVSEEVVIPAVANDGNADYSVVSIGRKAFLGCRLLTSVQIPESVTSIGEYAFQLCTSLTSVQIPESVTSIGEFAFRACSSLTSVQIPESVTSIGAAAFDSCSSLTSVQIPESVTSIGAAAFMGCSSLTSVQIPKSVTSIRKNVFNGCTSLTSVQIPEGVTSIEDSAFEGCSSLTSVQIPEGVTSIWSSAFEGCSSLTSVQIPEGVTLIWSSAFKGCSSLTSVQIPKSVTSIGDSAFEGCSSLTYVIIQSILSINGSTFSNCDSLIKVACPSGLDFPYYYNVTVTTYPSDVIIEDGFVYGPDKDAIYFAPPSLEGEYVIPATVGTIFDNAFTRCDGLTSVKSENKTLPVISESSFSGLYASVELSIPATAFNSYLASAWSQFEKIRIEDSVYEGFTYETGNLKYKLLPGVPGEDENIAIVIPGDYSSLTEVTVPERITYSDNGINTRYKVTGIGYKAFNNRDNLTKVTFNSRNASRVIGNYAFAGTQISALTIPETVETIGTHAFDGCKSLTGIVIPGSVGTIGEYAFNGCTAMINAKLEAGVRTIGSYAFNNTDALKEVTLNEGLESIGEKCFSASRDRNIEPIYIPSTLTSVGIDAFYNFNCRYVNISDLTAWCNIDFDNNNSNPAANRQGLYLNGEIIENLVIPESVNAIKDYAFCYNSTLKSVTFNEVLQSIGAKAFMGCSGLFTAVIPGNVTAIGDNAFKNTNVENLTLAYGAEQIEIGSNAFPNLTRLSCDRPLEALNLSLNSLESLTIGNSVTEIPATAFKGISCLADITLGNSLIAIGDEAFSGCTGLKEVIVPPSVETIGASAFAGNDGLTSIIMGHSVKSIGEKAFDLCPAQTVSITAQTPPDAPDNTFSNYTGSLYVQGEEAVEAYYDADFCWYQFEGYVMIEPTELKVEGNKTISGKPGDTFQLTATLYPEDVTLPQIFWRSTNPDIATVDANGLVTLHADMSEAMAMAEGDDDSATSCKIIAESLYANGPVAEVSVSNVSTGVETIIGNDNSGEIDFSAPVEVYTLQGVKVSAETAGLAPGIYIVRQGDNVRKIAVK